MSDRVVSPILYATPFVGQMEPHKEDGKLWLHCAEYGFALCVAGIAKSFGPILHGEVVRVEVALEPFEGSKPFPLDAATRISDFADDMVGRLFGAELGTVEFDHQVLKHLGFEPEDEDLEDFPDLEMALPGEVHYLVRWV